jgi:hypothetical protein
MATANCQHCAQTFQVTRGRRVFCSLPCQRRANLQQPVSVQQRLATKKRSVEAYRRRHPERQKAQRQRWQWRRYGLTPEDYAARVAAQGGGCAICGATDPGAGRVVFHLDHCHTTGALRGFLCGGCNLTLGHFNDDPNRFVAAAEYLDARQRGSE